MDGLFGWKFRTMTADEGGKTQTEFPLIETIIYGRGRRPDVQDCGRPCVTNVGAHCAVFARRTFAALQRIAREESLVGARH